MSFQVTDLKVDYFLSEHPFTMLVV